MVSHSARPSRRARFWVVRIPLMFFDRPVTGVIRAVTEAISSHMSSTGATTLSRFLQSLMLDFRAVALVDIPVSLGWGGFYSTSTWAGIDDLWRRLCCVVWCVSFRFCVLSVDAYVLKPASTLPLGFPLCLHVEFSAFKKNAAVIIPKWRIVVRG